MERVALLRRRTVAIAILTIVLILSVFAVLWFWEDQDPEVIVTISALSSNADGTLRLRHEIKLSGQPVSVYLSRRSGSSVMTYQLAQQGKSVRERIIGPAVSPAGASEGSYELGCAEPYMIDVPQRIELKPGESRVVAFCVDASGKRTELVFQCK